MPTNRFDALSRTLSTRLSRRTALKTTGLGFAAGIAGTQASARQATRDATPEPSTDDATFLFVQTAASGSFTPNPGAGTPVVDGTPVPGGGADYLLTLEGHGGGTVYFSDRPDRIFGETPTRQFLDGLGFPASNPPNAALVTQTGAGEDLAILELVNPTYDDATGVLTYGAAILDEYTGDGLAHVAARQQDFMLLETFGRTSLFIDDCATPDLIYCVQPGTNAIVGNVEYQNMCWSIQDSACTPCAGGFHAMAVACDRRFPECDDACIACTQNCAQQGS